MKRILITFLLFLSSILTWAQIPQIGKSIGRSSYQNVEAMMLDKSEGLDYVEVTMNNVIAKDLAGAPERARQLMDDLQKAGIKVWSVHMPFSRTLDISVIDDARRNENIQYMKDAMQMAAVFHPQYIVLHPSSEPISPDEREQRLANSHAAIGYLATVAKEIGAVLCIENLPRTCLGQNGEEMMRLIEGYEDVGICFDTNHLLYQSHADFLKAIGKGTIKTVHLSDYDFSDERHLVAGKGLIDNKALWDGIKENGYEGIMMFECKGDVNELLTARQILLGNVPQPDNSKKDSIAFVNTEWEITRLKRGAQSMYAQLPMFYSTQSVCVVKYPMKKFKTETLHRPKDLSGKPSEIGKEIGAVFALSGGYGDAMAEGLTLIRDGNIVVPLLMGAQADMATRYSSALLHDKRHPRAVFGTDDKGNGYLVTIDGQLKGKADGATVYEAAYICWMLGMTDAVNLEGDGSAVLWTEKAGVINYPSGNKKYDHEGESTVSALIAVY